MGKIYYAEIMVVRGCQQRLLNIHTEYSESLAVRSYCEYDRDFPRPNSQGKIVFIKMLVDFCEG